MNDRSRSAPLRSEGVVVHGWLALGRTETFVAHHRPPAGSRIRCGVVLCNAFGSQSMVLHNQYRALAESLASAGCSVVRFDYPATGDSSDYPDGLDIGQAMATSVDEVVRWLCAESGVSEVCLFGALTGGTIALDRALRLEEVTGVVLWGTFGSGREFLRAASTFEALYEANPDGIRPSYWDEGDAESMGFLVPTESAAFFKELRPLAAEGSVRSALVLPKAPKARDAAVVQRLEELAVDVTVPSSFDVDLGALLEEVSYVRRNLVNEVTRWVVEAYPGDVSPSPPPSALPAVRDSISLTASTGGVVRERTLRIGPDSGIFGILTTRDPDTAAGSNGVGPCRVGVVLVNGGANHRVGINRNYTEWARNWADRGAACLRIDLRGLGDSVRLDGDQGPTLYRGEAHADVQEAVTALLAATSCERVVVIGLCAGAFHSMRAATDDDRIGRVVLLNPLRFFGEQDADAELLHRRGVVGRARRTAATGLLRWAGRAPGRDRSSPGARKRWTHRLPLNGIARALDPTAGAVSAAMWRLVDRGCSVHLVFNSNEPIVDAFQSDIVPDRNDLDRSGRFSIEFIEDADHIFSPLVAQERLTQHLDGVIGLELEVSDVVRGPAA